MPEGSALVLDNWRPTTTGVKARAGSLVWASPTGDGPAGTLWSAQHGTVEKMFVGTNSKIWDVTGAALSVAIGRGSAYNYHVVQTDAANTGWMIVVNANGDQVLLYNMNTNVWRTNTGIGPATPSMISGPAGTAVEFGANLVFVWKYRNRLYFLQSNSMDAWYLDVNALGGVLSKIPLSGAFRRGGKLLFGCVWSLDAGDGLDDKICFVTDRGEIAVFTGSNPADPANWRQEGRFDIAKPLSANATVRVGGDVLVATMDGIIPLSSCINKDPAALQLDAISRQIQKDYRKFMQTRSAVPWDLVKWDAGGLLFLIMPRNGAGDDRFVYVANLLTGAWTRYTNWDCYSG
ncbi:MAG: hypothetical protein H0U59_09695, partial [Gemmatimonadaceae bacterium]|nr:hypothetical protein [Gemmatimonadaceae bacterium]